MIESTVRHFTNLPVSVARVIDEVCTDFDRAFRSGETPNIEAYVARVGPLERTEVLRQLLAIELEYFAKTENPPTLDEYRRRFPNDISLVKAAYLSQLVPEKIGRFRVDAVLGKGGFGRVYLAYDKVLQRKIAVKVLLAERFPTQDDVEKFLDEARLAGRLRHPSIVGVHEVGQDEDGDYFAVLEYVDGTSLDRAIEAGALSMSRALGIMLTVLDAVQYAHENGLTHRDLKPENILLDQNGAAYVSDFGLAIDESTQQLRSREIAGTPPYMAPEQVAGETHRLDGRTDIWALGVILYELLAGCRPFSGADRQELFFAIRHLDPRPLRQRNSSIPKYLERITLKCLTKRMTDRYSAAVDLAADLKAAQAMIDDDLSDLVSAANGAQATDSVNRQSDEIDSGQRSAKIIPKGLRSFGARDSEFFLELLPGARDAQGVPESIRFWQSRIEETNADQTFSVGLVYGPSGCGKSSMIKAGLIPRLAVHVVPVFVEVTAEDTEIRLLKSLRRLFPQIPDDLAVPDILAAFRDGQWLPTDHKLLVVLDQFEQWLHANPSLTGTQLTDGLRHCDGGRVLAVLLVRDDFWMQITRFMRLIEVPLVEGNNSAAVDLFDISHAAKILAAFGTAYGKLPEKWIDWNRDQERFVELATQELAEDGHIVPVRLSLFAEMFKGKPWTPATLRNVGGTEGIGVSFLEDTFEARTAAPEHRFHRHAARAVLESLLPDEGADIKGHMRSERELIEQSGYAGKPDEFSRLIRILDTELRLITPTDPEGKLDDAGESSGFTATGNRFYQLTHDYLVSSVREWLSKKRQETARGRAQLRLAERTRIWSRTPQSRLLPGWWEWLGLVFLTRRANRSSVEGKMLLAAMRFHLLRGGVVGLVAIAVAFVAIHWVGHLRAAGMVQALETAKISDVPDLVSNMSPVRRWADPMLQDVFNHHEQDKERRLRAGLALMPVDPSKSKYLLAELLSSGPDEFPVICTMLAANAPSGTSDDLWKVLKNDGESPERRLRAGMAVARIDPSESKALGPFGAFLSNQLVRDITRSARFYDPWVTAIRANRNVLLAGLKEIYRDKSREAVQRRTASMILADLFADDHETLEELLLDAEPFQFPIVIEALDSHREQSVESMSSQLALSLDNDTVTNGATKEEARRRQQRKDDLALRRANAALALLQWGEAHRVWPHLVQTNNLSEGADSRFRSYFVNRFGDVGDSADILFGRLASATNPSELLTLILALGSLPEPKQPKGFKDRIVEHYKHHSDGGVHSAAEWTLRETDSGGVVGKEVQQELATGPPNAERRWYVTRTNHHTMILLPVPSGDFRVGSIECDPDVDSDEAPRLSRMTHTIAVCNTEVTQEQFLAFDPAFPHVLGDDDVNALERPINAVTWYEAAAYCNWLSRQEDLSEELCYVENEQGEVVKTATGVPKLRGYRLPTELEWEYACRAGTTTPRHYGNDVALLGKYAWYFENAEGRSHGVGRLKPNEFGLFDMLGNVIEWCHDRYRPLSPDPSRNLRGGSYKDSPRVVRSSNRNYRDPATRSLQYGFRVVRTVEWQERSKTQ